MKASSDKVTAALKAMEASLQAQADARPAPPKAKSNASQRLDDDDTGSRFSKVNRRIETQRKANGKK